MKCKCCGKIIIGKILILDNELFCPDCVEEKTMTIYTFPDGEIYNDDEIGVHYNKESLRESVVREIRYMEGYITRTGDKIDTSDLVELLNEIDKEEK